MTDIILAFMVVLSFIILFCGMSASYRNGVSDGAYNQWLPRVRKIIEADAKFPPPGYKKRPTEAEWLNEDDAND